MYDETQMMPAKSLKITQTLILFLLLRELLCLQLLELGVPTQVPLGARTSLSCRWQLDPAEVLYSVKWYKDGKEFFRHIPRDMEPRRQFSLPGVDVEYFSNSGSDLTLGPATISTEGRYRCEVSGEGPLFPTVSDHADLMVVVLPDHGPVITGCKSKYSIGDNVDITCNSGKSRPATQLTWFLNGEAASEKAVTLLDQTVEDEMFTTRINLTFLLTRRHFRKGGLKFKCLATLGSVYWKSYEETAVIDEAKMYEGINEFSFGNNHFAQLSSSSSDRRKSCEIIVFLLFTLFLFIVKCI